MPSCCAASVVNFGCCVTTDSVSVGVLDCNAASTFCEAPGSQQPVPSWLGWRTGLPPSTREAGVDRGCAGGTEQRRDAGDRRGVVDADGERAVLSVPPGATMPTAAGSSGFVWLPRVIVSERCANVFACSATRCASASVNCGGSAPCSTWTSIGFVDDPLGAAATSASASRFGSMPVPGLPGTTYDGARRSTPQWTARWDRRGPRPSSARAPSAATCAIDLERRCDLLRSRRAKRPMSIGRMKTLSPWRTSS